jgi:hypothetical protein
MARAYNPSYSEGEDQGHHNLRPAQAKKFERFPSQPIKAGSGGTHLLVQQCGKHK